MGNMLHFPIALASGFEAEFSEFMLFPKKRIIG